MFWSKGQKSSRHSFFFNFADPSIRENVKIQEDQRVGILVYKVTLANIYTVKIRITIIIL